MEALSAQLAAALRRIEELEAKVAGMERWTDALDRRLGVDDDNGEPPPRHLRVVRSLVLLPLLLWYGARKRPATAATATVAALGLVSLWLLLPGAAPQESPPQTVPTPPVTAPSKEPSDSSSPSRPSPRKRRPSTTMAPPLPAAPTVTRPAPSRSPASTVPSSPLPRPTTQPPVTEKPPDSDGRQGLCVHVDVHVLETDLCLST